MKRPLLYNRHRYYDPGSGRFVPKDPIGLAGGNSKNSWQS
nr:RHS repeat-associated core domain-containing protein [Paraburkholderia sp. BCC1885]